MSVEMEQNVKSFEIAEIAEARLSASSHSALRNVFCKYDNGVLVLRGRLNSFFHTNSKNRYATGVPNASS